VICWLIKLSFGSVKGDLEFLLSPWLASGCTQSAHTSARRPAVGLSTHSSSAWCLGGRLVYGEDAYSGRYRNAIEQTSLDYQTVRNSAWVARRFSLSRRRDTLTRAHHAEEARPPQPEEDVSLRKAMEMSWSRNRLRQEVRASLAERTDGESPDAAADHSCILPNGSTPDADTVAAPQAGKAPFGMQANNMDSLLIQLKLSPKQMECCQAPAARLGHSIEEWAVAALERASREEISRGEGR
jgi:hypothetical protein